MTDTKLEVELQNLLRLKTSVKKVFMIPHTPKYIYTVYFNL